MYLHKTVIRNSLLHKNRFFFSKQDATYTGDKDIFIHICAQEERQLLQVTIELEALRSQVRGVTAT